MADQPLVSVVIPCYNDGEYLQQAIESCLQQTMHEIEVIVVDDGSNDAVTRQVLEKQNNPRVTVLSADHTGPAAARNKAIAHARGKYILPLDADDWIDREYIANAVQVLDNAPDVGIVYCHAKLFGEQEGDWNLPDFALDTFLLDNCIFITAMFRKADWETIGGFSDEFKHGLEDYDFWLSMIELGREVHQFPDKWFHYRLKKESRTTQMISSVAATAKTYELLYQRHKALYMKHIDAYVQGLRRALIEQKALCGSNGAQKRDAVAEYWQTVKVLKPKRARQVERLLAFKDSLKGVKRWKKHE